MKRFILIVVASSILTACVATGHKPAPVPAPRQPEATTPTTGNSAKTRPYEVFGEHYYPITDATGYRERGVASWYGGKFHGRKTANGDRYDMYQYTAAHTTLPLPTWVKVTNLRNGATVTVRVNDRGPFVKNRLIDLSYAAALQLGMVDDGTTLVEVEAISGQPSIQAAPPVRPIVPETFPVNTTAGAQSIAATAAAAAQPESPDDAVDPGDASPTAIASLIFVQVGAFGERENAQRMQTTLYNAGIAEVRLDVGDLEGIPVHRVQIGPIDGVMEYDVLISQLEAIGISKTHLVTQ